MEKGSDGKYVSRVHGLSAVASFVVLLSLRARAACSRSSGPTRACRRFTKRTGGRRTWRRCWTRRRWRKGPPYLCCLTSHGCAICAFVCLFCFAFFFWVAAKGSAMPVAPVFT